VDAVDPVQLGAASDARGVPPPLRVIGSGRQQSDTYPLTNTVANLAS
jgi:hypothetical protein